VTTTIKKRIGIRIIKKRIGMRIMAKIETHTGSSLKEAEEQKAEETKPTLLDK
jgi:hypothetical protein